MNDVLAALLPPIGMLILFVIVIRALIGADRRERRARKKIEASMPHRDREDL